MKRLVWLLMVLALASCKTAQVDQGKRQIATSVTAQIKFDLTSATLSSDYTDEFNYILGFMMSKGDANFEIASHTNSVGAKKRNQEISQKRADKIKSLLIDKGMNPSKLTAVGYGESRPIASNKTSEGRHNNERIEIYLVSN